MTRPAGAAAFIDVDGTLVRGVTLFDFLAYWYPIERPGMQRRARVVEEVAALKSAGRPRAELNRLLFSVYQGMRPQRIAELAEQWWQARSATGEVFHRAMLARLESHRAAGDAVVLVSGSFDACLAPIARAVGADGIVCSTPVVVDGVYTGETEPLVGRAKPAAVLRYCADAGIRAADCAAYGDHESDLPLLDVVGHPAVVAGDPVLDRVACARGWDVVPVERSCPDLLLSSL